MNLQDKRKTNYIKQTSGSQPAVWKKAIHTRIASTQRQHYGKSCTELDNQHADNSSAREPEAIFSRTGIVP